MDTKEKQEARAYSKAVKLANIKHHDIEAAYFEQIFSEGSSTYEEYKTEESMSLILTQTQSKEVCADIGSGTGWLTRFEVPYFDKVIALDISPNMIKKVRSQLGNYASSSFILCDAENIPLRDNVLNLASISSVLHHLPHPFSALTDTSRTLKNNGIIYITREPNSHKYRKYSSAFDWMIIRNITLFFSKLVTSNNSIEDKGPSLDYSKVDIHYSSGLNLKQFVDFICDYSYDILKAFSYHWIFSREGGPLARRITSNSNFVIEKMPLSTHFGRYITIIAQKRAH